MSRFGHYVRQAAASLVLIATVLGSYAARADQILSDSYMITGTSVISSDGNTFSLPGPGTLSVTLENLSSPLPGLTDLSFSLMTATTVIGNFSGAGMASYDITGAGSFYALMTAEATNPASGPDYGAGIANLTIDFTPSAVPLPASLGLLLVALLGFALVQRGFADPRVSPTLLPLRV